MAYFVSLAQSSRGFIIYENDYGKADATAIYFDDEIGYGIVEDDNIPQGDVQECSTIKGLPVFSNNYVFVNGALCYNFNTLDKKYLKFWLDGFSGSMMVSLYNKDGVIWHKKHNATKKKSASELWKEANPEPHSYEYIIYDQKNKELVENNDFLYWDGSVLEMIPEKMKIRFSTARKRDVVELLHL